MYGFGFGFLRYGSSAAVAPSVPEQVANLVATEVDCALSVGLTWDAPYNGGSPITGYKIERKVGAGAYSTLVADTGNTNTSYSDTGLTLNTLYTYKVSAINTIGTGTASAESGATTDNIPSAPTLDSVTVVSDTELDLSWTAGATGGCAITGYKIERKVGAGAYSTLVADTGTTATTYSDTGLTASTLYTYKISAINAIGTSLASNEVGNTTYYTAAYTYVVNTQSDIVNYIGVVNALQGDLTAAGLWAKLKFGLLPAITLDDTKTVIDLKTGAALSGAALKGTVDTGVRSAMTTPIPIGFRMKQTGDYIKTGAIPTTIHTLNDTCIAHGILDNETGGTKFQYSSFQGAGNSFQGNLRTAGNSSIIDSYSNTGNAGRNTLGGGGVTNLSGRWIHNRRSSTDVELYRSGSSIGSAANGGGALPNIEMFLGAQNNAGSPASYGNHTCTYHLQFSGLTSGERNSLETVMSNYESNLGSLRTLTRNLIWDGNSLSVYDNSGAYRKAFYYQYAANKRLYRARNYAVAGQTTADMLADYATQIAPEYSGSYTKNIYVIDELRNDIYFGATVSAAMTTLADLVSAAQATGFIVVVNNIRASNFSGNTGRTETQFNLAMDEVATAVTANAFGADYIVEVNDSNLFVPRANYATDAEYNTAIAAIRNNATYFTDGTHGTPEYYRIMGNNVSTQALTPIG